MRRAEPVPTRELAVARVLTQIDSLPAESRMIKASIWSYAPESKTKGWGWHVSWHLTAGTDDIGSFDDRPRAIELFLAVVLNMGDSQHVGT